MSENTKTCPFCGEEILEVAKKCCHCGEWLKDKEEINEPIIKRLNEAKKCPYCHNEIMAWVKQCPHCDKWLVLKEEKKEKIPKKKNVTKRKIPWLRIGLGLTFIFLVVTMSIYEINAQKVLSHAQKLEKMGKYETATIAYKIVIEKSYLSFASINAKENFRKIITRDRVNSNKRLGTTFLENYVDDFSPYLHHGLPFVVCPIYTVVLLLIFITGLCRLKFKFSKFIWAGIFLGLFIVQLIEYEMIDYIFFPEFAHMIMGNPRILFISCYLLIIVGMIRSLIPREGK